MQFGIKCGKDNVWFGTFAHFNAAGIKHGVSARLGGLSQGPYASLNLGLHTGDDSKIVCENRQRFCQAVGVDFAQVVTAQQVHNDVIAVVTDDDAGKGHDNYDTAIKDTDALITDAANLPLMLFFADCVPVLLADPHRKAIGVSHAGWKGTVSKIAAKTVLAMQKHFGTKPEECLVGIGPSVGQCCYEVDNVVIDRLRAAFPWWQDVVVPQGDKWRLDLWAANRRQLIDIGVKPENIIVSNVCTACNTPLFFSHRAEHGRTGRLGAVISL